MIWFYANSRCASIVKDEDITTGSVGLEVGFSLSAEWEGLAKTAVFRAGDISVDVYLSEDHCAVPPELLTSPGEVLAVGLYGTDGSGGLVIPTVYAEAGRIVRGAEPSGVEPTPQTQPLIDQLLEAAEAAQKTAESVRDDAEAGAFDGADGQDGSNAWTIDAARVREFGSYLQCPISYLVGPSGAVPRAGDVVFVSDGRLTQIDRIVGQRADTILIGNLHGAPGEDGYSPAVTITEIEGGHRVTITDEDGDHVFDVLDGTGGGGTVDDAFSTTSKNPVQNKVITVAFNQAAQQLTNLRLALDDKVDKVSGKGLSTNDFTNSDKDKLDGAASETWVQQQGYITGADLALYRTEAQQDTIDDAQDAAIAAKYTKPSGGIPKTDLEAAVQTSLGKADTALQTSQGVAHAGEFCVVGSDGNITTVTMSAWQGGSY